ncbi:multimeric flavodoxin WrbA [Elusimicrobium simillimum]|uniref:flavodoxin family protein n=1 Tax=Elusimicrobium simillimum TaxID=3143438 RepID=UPI003C6F098B
MSKNILVITGSPREGGNTELLADAFIKGASANGHQTTRFDAGVKKLAACAACDNCWGNGLPCMFRDKFAELEPLLETADVLVIASPLYWFTVSAQIKAAIDRMYCYSHPNAKRKLKISESVFICCGAGEEDSFDAVISSYKLTADYMNWKNAGIIIAPGIVKKGDVAKTNLLDRAQKLGMSL